jgi:hypothetical protein
MKEEKVRINRETYALMFIAPAAIARYRKQLQFWVVLPLQKLFAMMK